MEGWWNCASVRGWSWVELASDGEPVSARALPYWEGQTPDSDCPSAGGLLYWEGQTSNSDCPSAGALPYLAESAPDGDSPSHGALCSLAGAITSPPADSWMGHTGGADWVGVDENSPGHTSTPPDIFPFTVGPGMARICYTFGGFLCYHLISMPFLLAILEMFHHLIANVLFLLIFYAAEIGEQHLLVTCHLLH